MTDLRGEAAYGSEAIDYINKPKVIEADGPMGFRQFMGDDKSEVTDTCLYASECVVASTWNVEMAEKQGKRVLLAPFFRRASGFKPKSGSNRMRACGTCTKRF